MRCHPSVQDPAVPSLRRFAVGLLCAVAVALLAPSGAAAKPDKVRCKELSFAVTLSPGSAEVYEVFGVLCSSGNIHHKTIQIALHGSTYSHSYWDWPLEPETYSYVRRATAAGYGEPRPHRRRP